MLVWELKPLGHHGGVMPVYGELIAWIQPRPHYCDRGRWHAQVEAPHWKSDSDPWPRYYFDIEVAKSEVLAYCIAKKIDVAGAEWVAVER